MSTATESKTLQVTRSFTASPERVFDAWLDPAMACRFLFATPTGEMVRVEIDAQVGGKFLIVRRTDGDDVEHVGEYLAIEPPRRLVFTFAVPKFSAQFTQVTIEIAPTAGGCMLTLTHEGVLPEWAERTQEGWGMILTGLDDTLQQPYATLIAPDTILLERLLPGPIERVWQCLTDPQKLSTWLGVATAIGQRAGTSFTLHMRNSDLSTVKETTPPQYAKYDAGHTSECVLTVCEPPRLLAFLWGKPEQDGAEVTITLTPQGKSVLLRLTHRRLAGAGRMSGFAAGWHTHLGFLVAHLNGRDPGSFWQAFAKNESEYAARKLDGAS